MCCALAVPGGTCRINSPISTVFTITFARYAAMVNWQRMNSALYRLSRQLQGRHPEPSAAINRQPECEDNRSGWCTRLRCWQKDQGTQTSYRNRHLGKHGGRRCPCSQHSGLSWRQTAPAFATSNRTFFTTYLGGQHLWTGWPGRMDAGFLSNRARNRQTQPWAKGLRCPPASLGRRAYLRLAKSLSSPEQRLRTLHPE